MRHPAPALLRCVLLCPLLLLLPGCGMGGGAILPEIDDQITLIDEPLAVDLGVSSGTRIEAVADDSAGLLAGGPLIETTAAGRRLLLEPRTLTKGATDITVTASSGASSASRSFRFEVVPPYRSAEQELDLAAEPGADMSSISIAFDGTTLALGTPRSAAGGLVDSGAVYLFELDQDEWVRTAIITPGDAHADHRFGAAVDISGDRLIVGTPSDDDVDENAGAVYIFERDASGWSQAVKVLPEPAAGRYQDFGKAVAIDGDIAAASAPGVDSDAGFDTGLVHVLKRGADGWRWVDTLTPRDPSSHDAFAEDIVIHGTTLVATVRGGYGLSPRRSFGVAYVFEERDGTWIQSARLTPLVEAAESFGSSLAFDGETVVVGAPHPSIEDRDGVFPGAIYVFESVNGSFDHLTTLVTGETGGDRLGGSVALAGDYLLSTAIIEGERQLMAYKRNGRQWAEVNRIPASQLGVESLGPMVMSKEHVFITAQAGGNDLVLNLPE